MQSKSSYAFSKEKGKLGRNRGSKCAREMIDPESNFLDHVFGLRGEAFSTKTIFMTNIRNLFILFFFFRTNIVTFQAISFSET